MSALPSTPDIGHLQSPTGPLLFGTPISARRSNRFKICRVKTRLLLGRCFALGTREFSAADQRPWAAAGALRSPRERRSGSATDQARANPNELGVFLGTPRACCRATVGRDIVL